MKNLYKKIYNAVNEGIQKALLIDPEQDNDVSINYSYHKINNQVEPILTELIDLGLPSGTLWSDHNLGATCGNTVDSWYGNYYTYDMSDHAKRMSCFIIMSPYEDPFTNYAKQQRHSSLRCEIPSNDDLKELIENTKCDFVQNYDGIPGLNGYILTSRINGNELFMPAAGFYSLRTLYNGYGVRTFGINEKCSVWSKTSEQVEDIVKHSNLYILKSTETGIGGSHSWDAMPIRGVCKAFN